MSPLPPDQAPVMPAETSQLAQPMARPGTPASTAPATWSSTQLLAGRRETEISHAGAIYRLRLTALGKLILTK